jgi:hypothetical protein
MQLDSQPGVYVGMLIQYAAGILLLVVYAHKTESMRRGGLACCRPIPSL